MYRLGIDQHILRRHRWNNRFQSLLLLGFMGGFLALLGGLLWGSSGVLMLLVAGAVGVLFNPALSPRWVMRLYRATPLAPQSVPSLGLLLNQLSERAGLPAVPTLYYVPSRALNAFAVGSRDDAAIAVTDGLLRNLNQRELVGVLAHEISHVAHNDLWVIGLADLFTRATGLLSLLGQLLLLVNLPLLAVGAVTVNWFAVLLLIFAPTISTLAQLALSRTREFDADLGAASLTGDPRGLASALDKLERAQGGWLERIFMPSRRLPVPGWLRTHPETAERVARLMQLQPRTTELTPALADSPLLIPASLGEAVRRAPRWHVNGFWY